MVLASWLPEQPAASRNSPMERELAWRFMRSGRTRWRNERDVWDWPVGRARRRILRSQRQEVDSGRLTNYLCFSSAFYLDLNVSKDHEENCNQHYSDRGPAKDEARRQNEGVASRTSSSGPADSAGAVRTELLGFVFHSIRQ